MTSTILSFVTSLLITWNVVAGLEGVTDDQLWEINTVTGVDTIKDVAMIWKYHDHLDTNGRSIAETDAPISSFCSNIFMIVTCITKLSKTGPFDMTFSAYSGDTSSHSFISVMDQQPITHTHQNADGFTVGCVTLKPDLLFEKTQIAGTEDIQLRCLIQGPLLVEVQNLGAATDIEFETYTTRKYIHRLPYRKVSNKPSLFIIPPDLCNPVCILEYEEQKIEFKPVVSENGKQRLDTKDTKSPLVAWIADIPAYHAPGQRAYSIYSLDQMENPKLTITYNIPHRPAAE